MTTGPQDTYDWYDDAASLEGSDVQSTLPGLPASFRRIGWWLASLAFAAIWMTESWTTASVGDRGFSDVAEGVWSMLLALGMCWCIYKFLRHRSRSFAHLLCIGSAVVLLLHHVIGH